MRWEKLGLQFFCLFLFQWLAGPVLGGKPAAAPETAAPAEYVRFIEATPGDALQVAVASYLHPEGVQVELVGAIHIADPAYYAELNRRFEAMDAVLFELVGDPSALTAAQDQEASPGMVRMLQMMLTNVLELEFQLDGIDYSPDHFVHADLTAEAFARLQEERGETLFTFFLNTMKTQMAQANGAASPVGLPQLIRALTAKRRSEGLKRLFAEQLAQSETLLGAAEAENESVLLTGRNRRAMEVLQEEVSRGHRKLALFYGAAHCPDLGRRLEDLGYRRVGKQWLTAWELSSPSDERLPSPSEASPAPQPSAAQELP